MISGKLIVYNACHSFIDTLHHVVGAHPPRQHDHYPGHYHRTSMGIKIRVHRATDPPTQLLCRVKHDASRIDRCPHFIYSLSLPLSSLYHQDIDDIQSWGISWWSASNGEPQIFSPLRNRVVFLSNISFNLINSISDNIFVSCDTHEN